MEVLPRACPWPSFRLLSSCVKLHADAVGPAVCPVENIKPPNTSVLVIRQRLHSCGTTRVGCGSLTNERLPMKIARQFPRPAARVAVSVIAVLAAAFALPTLAQTTNTVINPNHGTVVVKKFYDANANGRRDTGELWLSGSTSGWPVTLTGPGGVNSAKRTTATFSGLNGGS